MVTQPATQTKNKINNAKNKWDDNTNVPHEHKAQQDLRNKVVPFSFNQMTTKKVVDKHEELSISVLMTDHKHACDMKVIGLQNPDALIISEKHCAMRTVDFLKREKMRQTKKG